jgi:D-3-phosphoglycerate dehydrogenase
VTKVVSLVAERRYLKFGVQFPADWTVVYAPDDKDETLLPLVGDADFILCSGNTGVSKAVIDGAPNCKLIHAEGVAYNKIDCAYAKIKGIPVCNNRGVNSVPVAEHTIGLMLAGLCRLAVNDYGCRSGKYLETQRAYMAEGRNELASRHIGLYGLGAIGREVAKRLKPFGCKVSYFDVYRPTPEQEQELGIRYLPFEDLLRTCDVITIHVPVLPSTANSISYAQFDMMPDNTLLINTARGDIIDQTALIDALEKDKIFGAALDTFAPEPPPPDEPLFKMSEKAMRKLTLTPHQGGTNDEAFKRMLVWTMENMQRVLAGEQPINVVN